jgi:tRNA(fMet)-specific endonuclease VapC
VIFWLIDTDHYSLQERGHPRLREHLAAIPPDSIAVSVVTMEEMLRGRLAMLSRQLPREEWAHAYQKLMDTTAFFESVLVLPFEMPCQEKFEELRARRIRIGTKDLRIAAIALVNGLTLVTRNRKDFAQVPDLLLEDWTVSPPA